MKFSRRRFLGSMASAFCFHDVLWNTTNVWGQAAGGKKAYAVCIGLGEVGGEFYEGWQGKLFGTIPDANLYHDEVIPNSFKKKKLLNQEATTANVYRHILWAAKDLMPGDIFLLTLASHGMEVPDESGDEKVNSPTDVDDEAWCLWDRPLLDDELNYMWSYFRLGVRIVLAIDACHSGTSARNVSDLNKFGAQANSLVIQGLDRDLPIDPAKRAKVRREGKTGTLGNLITKDAKAGDANQKLHNDGAASATLAEKVIKANEMKHVRNAPDFLAKALCKRDRESRNLISRGLSEMNVTGGDGMRETSSTGASILTLAACRDDQTSMEDGSHGFFTSVLAEVWNRGEFGGSYRKFMERIQEEMKRSHGDAQTPFLDKFGGDLRFIDNERPFTI